MSRFNDPRVRPAVQFVAIAALLGLIAALAPSPWYQTDRGTYEAIGRQHVVPDCSGLHCFRVLVAWGIEALPGPSLFKWKVYAVLANAAAAIALAQLCLVLGLTVRAATLASWIAAVGFGSLFTLFDPHTSDPLMYFLGPFLLTLLLENRIGSAGVASGIGIFAKEFAAGPLWTFTVAAGLGRRWETAARALLASMTVTLVWLVFHLWLMLTYNYSYGGESASADLLGGGYLHVWASYVSLRVAASVIFAEFGAVFLLIPFGLLQCSRELRRLAIAAIPAVIALGYVQQPDRALWNFHFLAIPIGVVVLERLPAAAAWLFVVSYGVANLRFGAQLAFAPPARFPIAISLVIAVTAIALSFRKPIMIAAPAPELGSR